MKISKKHKKHAKQAMRGVQFSGEVKTRKRTWSFRMGDLVKSNGTWGIIIDDLGDGVFMIMTPTGTDACRAARLERVQKHTSARATTRND